MADPKQLERIKKDIKGWNTWVKRYIKPIDLIRANLAKADLIGATLIEANLDRANLALADLTEADLSEAYLAEADLRRAILTEACLIDADLTRTCLIGADLTRAILTGANLTEARLVGANLFEANLFAANLTNIQASPPALLLAQWGRVSPELCRDLMRYDAANHPDPEAFDQWAREGEPCPYGSTAWLRAANFTEDRTLWSPGPAPSALELCLRLIKEKCRCND